MLDSTGLAWHKLPGPCTLMPISNSTAAPVVVDGKRILLSEGSVVVVEGSAVLIVRVCDGQSSGMQRSVLSRGSESATGGRLASQTHILTDISDQGLVGDQQILLQQGTNAGRVLALACRRKERIDGYLQVRLSGVMELSEPPSGSR
jgi:hypothetical protein